MDSHYHPRPASIPAGQAAYMSYIINYLLILKGSVLIILPESSRINFRLFSVLIKL